MASWISAPVQADGTTITNTGGTLSAVQKRILLGKDSSAPTGTQYCAPVGATTPDGVEASSAMPMPPMTLTEFDVMLTQIVSGADTLKVGLMHNGSFVSGSEVTFNSADAVGDVKTVSFSLTLAAEDKLSVRQVRTTAQGRAAWAVYRA